MYRIGPVHQQFPLLFDNGDAPPADAAAETTAAGLDNSTDADIAWQNGFWQNYLPLPAAPPAPPVPAATSGAVSNAIGPVTDSDGSGIDANGDSDIKGPDARGTFDIDGTGIRVGIISDSFNNQGGAATEEADGDLPTTVTVLSDAASGGLDEGRALAELVHAIAPGAQIYFATRGNNEGDTAQAVASLEAAGCNVIVDDVSWSTEPFFQDGSPLQSAIETATTAGVSYFTSAGNQADNYYQGTVGTFPTLEITSSSGGDIEIDLQWTQPFASFPAGAMGSAYSLGWTLYDHGTTTIVASSLNSDVGQDPVQDATVGLPGSGSYDLVIANNGGSLVTTDTYKVIVLASVAASVSLSGPSGVGTGSGTVFGHALPLSVNAVGAVNAGSPTQVESYSAYGPGELFYDAAGNPIASPQPAGKPNFLAPDNVTTSVSGFGTFAGTSAAAPNAAGVGALLLQINPNLTPAEIQAALEATASTTGLSGAAAQFGAGLINADAAAALLYDSVVAWNHVSGIWNTAADWSTASAPAATSYVTLGDNRGTLTAAYTVTLSSAAGTIDTLTVGNAGTISTALAISSGGSLIVAGGATVGHDGQVTIGATGSLQVDGTFQLDDTSGATATLTLLSDARVTADNFNIIGGDASVAAGASLSVTGGGTLGEGDNGTLSVTGGATVDGNLVVSPTGQLAIGASGSLGVGGTLTLQVGESAEIGAGGTLSVASLVGGKLIPSSTRAHLTIDNGGVLAVSNSGSAYLTGTNTGDLVGTIIEHVANTHAHILLTGVAFAGSTLIFTSLSSFGLLQIDNPGTSVAALLGFDKTQDLTQSMFSTTDVGGDLQVNIACYQRGTRIATPGGEVPVEALRIGDEVLTASGTPRPIRWIGRRSYTAAQTAAQPMLRPIRIAAGALGPLRPRRDLLVSRQHAVLLRDPGDGREVLVPAVQLVNGVTITHEAASAEVSYFHLELAGHDVVLAEGQPAETFVDRDSRSAFSNAAEYSRLYPGAAAAEVPFCAPRIEGGSALARIRAMLEDWSGLRPGRMVGAVDRVAADRVEGWAHDLDTPAGPVLLEILVDDAVAGVLLADQFRADLGAMNGGHCAFFFVMPPWWAIWPESRVTVRRARDGREVPRTAVSLATDSAALGQSGAKLRASIAA